MSGFASLLRAIRELHHTPSAAIALHAPVFTGKEREYVLETIESTVVSSVGAFVGEFEQALRSTTGAAGVVACVNGTAALHMALVLAGVRRDDLVLTQALSFVATANAVRHAQAEPVFLDIDADTLGLSPGSLAAFLEKECAVDGGECRHKESGRRVAACVPMHTFGLPCRIDAICDICSQWGIPVVEDAAEALGSTYKGRHCGTFGLLASLSFNGNKIVTTGGGGAVLTDQPELAARARHITTTAKRPHRWEFYHDEAAWNYRMPNINAALGCAQMEQLPMFLACKRDLAASYQRLFAGTPWTCVKEPPGGHSNYWLCAVLFRDRKERDAFLAESNDAGIMTRPAWTPLATLPAFQDCLSDGLEKTMFVAERLVNLPSSVRRRV